MLSSRISRKRLPLMQRVLGLLVSVTLIVTGALIGTANRAQASSTASVAASDDAYAVASQPTTRTGANTTLLEGTLTTDRVVYLKFTVTAVPADSQVLVQLFSERASRIPARLHVVGDASWSQDTLHWNNRPAVGAQVAAVAGVPLNDWVVFNVTSVVTHPGIYSFAVDSPAGGTANNVFSSIENSNGHGPRLVVGATTPPSASSVGAS
jgi:hypothetical protein